MEREYFPEELVSAFAEDEVARYERMQHEHGPSYAVLTLPDREDVAELTSDEVDWAVYELARERGIDAGDSATCSPCQAVSGTLRAGQRPSWSWLPWTTTPTCSS